MVSLIADNVLLLAAIGALIIVSAADVQQAWKSYKRKFGHGTNKESSGRERWVGFIDWRRTGRKFNLHHRKRDKNWIISPKHLHYALCKAYCRKLITDLTGLKSIASERLRFDIFNETYTKVEKHNALFLRKEVGFRLGINKFSAWTKKEKSRATGLKAPANIDQIVPIYDPDQGVRGLPATADLPESVDWRERDAVSKVKDQVGAIEGQLLQRREKRCDKHDDDALSVQQLADCAAQSPDCEEGDWPKRVMDDYLKENHLVKATNYPYTGTRDECKHDIVSEHGHVRLTRSRYVYPRKSDAALMKAVAKIGPISVVVDARNLYDVESGIVDLKCEKGFFDHAVLVVGYGKDPDSGNNYWIIKNSWGESWAEAGYARILMNDNACSISSLGVYPILA